MILKAAQGNSVQILIAVLLHFMDRKIETVVPLFPVNSYRTVDVDFALPTTITQIVFMGHSIVLLLMFIQNFGFFEWNHKEIKLPEYVS